MMDVVDDPHVVRRIVGADQHGMWTAAVREQVVPLRPGLDGLAVAIDDDDAIAEFGRGRGRLFVERSPESREARRQRHGQL